MGNPSSQTDAPADKNKSWVLAYEPDATKLVIQIQDSTDIEENKKRLEKLFELIRPFVTWVIEHNLKLFYAKRDTEDAVQEFMFKHIMDNDPTRRSFMCLYRYDRLQKGKDGSLTSFCKYMGVYLSKYCKYWDQKSYKEQDHRGPSLNVDDSDNPEAKAALIDEAKVSKEIFQRETELRAFKETIPLVASCYLRFFNAVNILDRDKTYGKPFQDKEHMVNERKLLAYHIRLINREFRLSPKSRQYSVDQFRAFSYTQVNYKNNYFLQDEVFNVTMDFMKLLEERIASRNLADTVFLPPDKNIRTTVDEWLRAPTMKKRTDLEYVKLRADIRHIGEECIYGVRV